jgi:hypothetical protein
MIEDLIRRPIVGGATMFVLMTIDWVLTVLQARAATGAFRKHYGTYPVDTVEGNPVWRGDVARRSFLNPRHLVASILVAVFVGVVLSGMPERGPALLFLGAALGAFLVVIAIHLSNVIAYAGARRGVHGRVVIHLRTGYVMSVGRYAGIAVLLGAIAIVVPHPFLLGTALAAAVGVLRQLLFRWRSPRIGSGDPTPTIAAGTRYVRGRHHLFALRLGAKRQRDKE